MFERGYLTPQEISQKYDRFAQWYDIVEGVPDLPGIRKLRRLLQQASGRVLEVAVGTGKNLSYYLRGCQIIAVDLSSDMLAIAQKRASRLRKLCLFQERALTRSSPLFQRVRFQIRSTRFETWLAFAAQGKDPSSGAWPSDHEWLGRWQDRHADKFARLLGCHWNREPLALVREAGLNIIEAQRVFLGIFHNIEVEPR